MAKLSKKEKAATRLELQNPEYAGLTGQEKALQYNASTVASTRFVSGAEMIAVISAADLANLTLDQKTNLLLLRDEEVDLDTAEGIAKVETVFFSESSAYVKVIALKNITVKKFKQITHADVQEVLK